MSNIYFLEKYGDASIYIKREDLHPFSFGGNKVKIAQELFRDLEEKGCTSVVSFGSPTSNMNRAIAQMASSKGIPCHVIMKREDDPGTPICMNERFVRDSGAMITECTPDNVAETVEEVMETAKKHGEKPYYIYGSKTGHGNEEVLMRAYGKQYWPIREYENQENVRFRHIFVPVGTAATISGLVASISEGYEVAEPDIRVHGISIARKAPVVRETILKFLSSCGYDTKLCLSIAGVTDDYLGGGYTWNPAKQEILPVHLLIRYMFRKYGLPLDPVYTGKAYYGMLQEIGKEHITGDVLFIHTGGLPLFYDFFRSVYPDLNKEME